MDNEILLDTLSNDAPRKCLYPLIVFRLTTLDDPKLPYKQTEEMGLKQAKEFSKDWQQSQEAEN